MDNLAINYLLKQLHSRYQSVICIGTKVPAVNLKSLPYK